MRILVAEDDEGLREVLVLGLTDAGYHVDAVDRGDDAIDQLKWYEYDVAVIDWRMPGAEGIDVVAWARKHERPTGLLMLTARDTPADRIRGLDTGADDYLVKPFDFGELLARVRALQRRPRGVDAPVLRCGRLALDPVTRQVTVGGAERALTATEYRILELLLRRMPAVAAFVLGVRMPAPPAPVGLVGRRHRTARRAQLVQPAHGVPRLVLGRLFDGHMEQ